MTTKTGQLCKRAKGELADQCWDARALCKLHASAIQRDSIQPSRGSDRGHCFLEASFIRERTVAMGRKEAEEGFSKACLWRPGRRIQSTLPKGLEPGKEVTRLTKQWRQPGAVGYKPGWRATAWERVCCFLFSRVISLTIWTLCKAGNPWTWRADFHLTV